MKCPVCKDVTLLMADKHGIEIDYCPECRGVWLDRGELNKIIERTEEADREESAGRRQDRQPDRRQDEYPDRQRDRYPDEQPERYHDRHPEKYHDKHSDGYHNRRPDSHSDRSSHDYRDYPHKKRTSSMLGEIFEMFGGE